MRRPRGPLEWGAIAAITTAAAALRLIAISKVAPDPFYDAAVRSMTLSWHNFFFGAFEPGASVSIDKPPVDLWLQVASVKVLGFSTTTLKVPEILAGILAVPLLYEAVRRMWSATAGLAAAVALAVLPVSVITSRSDTMDGVMMMLLVLALLMVVRAIETGRARWLIAGAAALGVAFDVKLLESLVALPGLAALALVGMPGPARRRVLSFAAAGAVYVVVALSWLTATLIAPAHDRPWAIGSTNGSAWNAAFVFNGTDRLGHKSSEPQFTVYEPGHRYPQATQSQRDHIPIVPPSATRLLARIGPLSGQRLGLMLLIGLLTGIPALVWGLRAGNDPEVDEEALEASREQDARRAGATTSPPRDGERGSSTSEPVADASGLRMSRGAAAGLVLWTVTGIVLFSHMERLHPRYVEGFTPAVAALLGIGAAWAAQVRGWLRAAVLGIALVVAVYYSERLLYATSATWWISLAGALGALALALGARLWPSPRTVARRRPLSLAVLTLALVCVLAVPVGADVTAIETHVTDAGYVGAIPSDEQRVLSSYLKVHQGSAYYEVAAESATSIGSLIVSDARPVLMLTTYDGRVFTSVAKLRRLIAADKVRYAYLNTFCGRHSTSLNAACSAPAKWIRANGTDVSARAGLGQHGVLWLLPGARAR